MTWPGLLPSAGAADVTCDAFEVNGATLASYGFFLQPGLSYPTTYLSVSARAVVQFAFGSTHRLGDGKTALQRNPLLAAV